ncbi:MAG: sulfite exporter TauE/SafE family protein [Isosphaeraceae bacterium]|nr:sulfite exporter TauE/SafE family protein [Isosphaeraceae bacterium]
MLLYLVGGATVFVGSGVMAMAGLGAAFLFVPLFFYLGVPLGQATSAALLLNAVSLSAATIAYARAGLIDWRAGVPVLIAAVLLAPVGAALTAQVDRSLLIALFVGFLVFAGAMMLFYRPRAGGRDRTVAAEAGVGAAVGGVAGFLGGLLGVGGGNVILPGLTWLGLDAKVAAGTTALAVVFSSLSGFLGHAALGGLDPGFLVTMAALAAGGSLAGSHVMRTRLSGAQLKRVIGVLLFVIAAKMALDLIT